MAYSLTLWTHPTSGQIRLYVNGTTRSGVYLMRSPTTGRVVWSSKTADTPPKFRKGDHYGKVNKDSAAANDVAAMFGIVLGDASLADADAIWERACGLARDGIQLEA